MEFFLAHHHHNKSGHNGTLDVTAKNCFRDYDGIACLRSSLLCGLTLVTALICLARIVRLHMTRRPDVHQYAVFYLAVVQCLVSSVEWVLGWTPHASLVCLYLQCCAVLVVCHFYLVFTCRLLNLSERRKHLFVTPVLLGFFVYFTVMVSLGLVGINDWWCACFLYQWLALVAGQVGLLQILLLVLLVLLRRISLVSGEERLKKSQRIDIMVLLATLELGVLLSLGYHTTIKLKQMGATDCSEVFNHQQVLYSSIRLPVDIVCYLAPIWALLFVFRRNAAAGEENYSQLDTSSVTTLTDGMMDPAVPIDPTLIPSPMIRQWRRYYRPVNGRLVLPYTAPSYQRLGRSRTFSRIRHATGANSSAIRRTNSSPTVKRSPQPPLATIPEESGHRGSQRGSADRTGQLATTGQSSPTQIYSAPSLV